MIVALLALFFPDPARLGDRDFHVRAETHRALSSPLGALVAWGHTPATPEAAWRRARIVGDALRPLTAPWYEYPALIAALAEDPRVILLSPRHFCRMIDAAGHFWREDSYGWAEIPVRGDPEWCVERDLITVATEAVRRFFHEPY